MKKEKEIQELFYSQYASLCKQAGRYITNNAICEDIVQDCFVKYWENYETTAASIKNPAAYLTTSVRNNCISYLRKEKLEDNIEEVELQGKLNNSTEEEKENNEDVLDELAIIAKAMEQLPEKCRHVFELSKIKKKSYKEIAEMLAISVKTVENQMGKALKIMRQFAKENPQFFPILIILLQTAL